MIINNRTRRYLYPIINTFGKTFLQELDNITAYTKTYTGSTILSISISDLIYYRCKGFKTCLFIVFDINGVFDHKKDKYINPIEARKRFYNFLVFARTNKNYVDDYQLKHKKQHCVVVNILEFQRSYESFLKGKYSEMYTREQLKFLGYEPFSKVGANQEPNRNFIVLTKDKDLGKVVLKKAIQETYGVNDAPENPDEYDIPWDLYEEVLNFEYAKENEIEFFKELKR